MALVLANVQTTDTFQTWFNRTNEIINYSGNTVLSGVTTTVTSSNTDITGYLKLASNGQLRLPVGSTAQRVEDTVGSLRYNSETGEFEGYSVDGWGQIGGGGLGKFEFISSNYTAEAGNRIAANTAGGGFTVTLPASPSVDDIVEFIDENGTFNTGNLTVARNGSTIENLAQDLIADISGVNFYTQYDGSTWRVFGIAAGTQYFTGTLSVADLAVTANATVGGILSVTGDISGRQISVTQSVTGNTGNFLNTLSALDFNSTSDISLKDNVVTLSTAAQTVSQLRGVTFNWKQTDERGYGVIAQELEAVVPDLVSINADGTKSVKYNGLIGFLIECNKELLQRVEALEQKLKD